MVINRATEMQLQYFFIFTPSLNFKRLRLKLTLQLSILSHSKVYIYSVFQTLDNLASDIKTLTKTINRLDIQNTRKCNKKIKSKQHRFLSFFSFSHFLLFLTQFINIKKFSFNFLLLSILSFLYISSQT